MKISSLLYLSTGLLAGLVIGVNAVKVPLAAEGDFIAGAINSFPQEIDPDEGLQPGLATIRLGGNSEIATLEIFASAPSFIVIRDGRDNIVMETEIEPGEERLVHTAPPLPVDPPSNSAPIVEKRTSQWAWADETE